MNGRTRDILSRNKFTDMRINLPIPIVSTKSVDFMNISISPYFGIYLIK